jgi:dienelactone hydrolase
MKPAKVIVRNPRSDGRLVAAFCLVLLLGPSLMAGDQGTKEAQPDAPPAMQILRAPGGVRFGLFGAKGTAPAPTLFVFAVGLEDMQKHPNYSDVGRRLAKHGFLYVALDPPCHGDDVKPKEPTQLSGWRHRLENGDALIPNFTARATEVLDHMVKEGYTDPARVAACGTSRGGFLAYHFAVAEPRIKAVAGFSPVTDLMALREFASTKNAEAAQALALEKHAVKLAGRPLWLSIGNDDQRVSTDAAIAFTRKLVAAGVAVRKDALRPVPVELIVGANPGHSAIKDAHELAAAWLLKQLQATAAPK